MDIQCWYVEYFMKEQQVGLSCCGTVIGHSNSTNLDIWDGSHLLVESFHRYSLACLFQHQTAMSKSTCISMRIQFNPHMLKFIIRARLLTLLLPSSFPGVSSQDLVDPSDLPDRIKLGPLIGGKGGDRTTSLLAILAILGIILIPPGSD